MAISFLDKTGLTSLWAKIKATFALKSEIPDSTSDLTNDSGFITSANIPQSDWNQNNSSANDYVKNRVCYTGNPTMTEVLYSVIPTGSNMRFAEDGEISFTEASTEVDTYSDLGGTAYSVTIGETTYTGTIQSHDQDGWYENIAGNPHMKNSDYADNGMPFYTDFWAISVGDSVVSDTRFSLSLAIPEIHKLDDKYLNGALIKRGTGVYSVTLNGEFNELTASGDNSIAEGYYSTASGYASHSEGSSTASGYASHSEGSSTASGEYGHSEGFDSTASGDYSHSENYETFASADYSHAEGYQTKSSGLYSHSEGYRNVASGVSSHSEGGADTRVDSARPMLQLTGDANATTYNIFINTTNAPSLVGYALNSADNYIVSETVVDGTIKTITLTKTLSTRSVGNSQKWYIVSKNEAKGLSSHAEGAYTIADGYFSHSENMWTHATGSASHAEGNITSVTGDYGHVEGHGNIANHRSQHVFGEYNVADNSAAASTSRGNYVEIVGNGSKESRSNARTLDWNGNEVLAGKLTVGTAPTANMDVATKKYVDDAVAGSGGSSASNNPTLETEWVDVYSDWAAGYYYDPDNNYAYTQIPSTEMIWGSQTARTNTSCTPYSNLVPVKAGEEYRYQNSPIHFDSKNAEMPSIIIFDSTKSEVEAYTRTYQDEWTEFTIPANGAWMAVLYYNDQTYYLQKKEAAEDKFDILADVYANYRTYVNTVPPVLNTPTKGYICMGTDDLRRDQTKSLHELYTNANIPYFIAAIPENVKKCITDDPYKTNLDYMRLCVTAGGEIISHNTDQITAQNVDDFDFINKYFRGNKKELEAYGFTVNGIHKAGGSGYISGRDKRIDSWATAYYEHGDLFGYAYPYLAEREILEYIGSTSRIDDIVEDVCVNHGFAFITTHELSNDTQTLFNYLMSKLGQYTRGTDYEFVTPSQLYTLLMPSTPPSSGGGGVAITYSLSMSSNVITLTGSNGSTSSVTLPVYTGGVTS